MKRNGEIGGKTIDDCFRESLEYCTLIQSARNCGIQNYLDQKQRRKKSNILYLVILNIRA